MEPDLAPSGSAIRKIISKTIRFDVEKIPKKSDVSAFCSQMNLLFPETWYNKQVIRRIVTIFKNPDHKVRNYYEATRFTILRYRFSDVPIPDILPR